MSHNNIFILQITNHLNFRMLLEEIPKVAEHF